MVRNYDLKLHNIPKERYRELKHFCLQYPNWKKELANMGDCVKATVITGMPKGGNAYNDQMANLVARRIELQKKCQMVEESAKLADDFLGSYILEAVTGDLSFTYLRTVRNIPCGKNEYYKARRKFFYELDKMRENGAIV